MVVELMARFDEEANINWAARLEEAGAHVVYGVVGYKTHAKMLLVVRREEGRAAPLRASRHRQLPSAHRQAVHRFRPVHLQRARSCSDVNDVFMQLTGLGKASKHDPPVAVAVHPARADASRRSATRARMRKRRQAGGDHRQDEFPARTGSDPGAVRGLQAGVKIDLIVRGVCALRPGIPGVSENIRVRSIIGRFLEHTRIFYFRNNGAQDVYLSSADWMDRNFFRRIEVGFPVLDPRLKQRVIKEGPRSLPQG